jgi:hypothetical protein
MTVIAWDGETVAADTRATSGTSIVPVLDKKIVSQNGVSLAGCGVAHEVDAWQYDYFNGIIRPLKGKGSIVLEFREGKCFVWESGASVPYAVRSPFTIGSGGDVAMGAMLAGKTATEAVRIACKVDTACGLPVQTVKLK